ncbi:restriction endonuclease subunit S [Helicobacter pylori]|uniref:restriction endonuclease subunit S n=1 Tax=Helicobacter pylori TaxID=210 RepID=UPI0002BD9CF4|nr:restriction endonuclease subunit S [Helicobacter pylori]EMJ42773.1 type I restriction modification DNA specificity domain protein [Helicobacter pylori GAMchJs124i]
MDALTTPLPKDWKKVRLGDIAEIIGGGTPSTQITSFWNGSINWFTATEIGITKYVYKSQRTITPLGLKKSSAKLLPIGTILLTSRASIGDCAILKVVATTNQDFQSLIPLEKINNEFLYYLMLTLKNKLLKLASGSIFLGVSPNKIKNLLIPLPPLNEQAAIANVLSDVDHYLYSLDALILKKESVKKALSFELLSQRKRLKGFNQAWQKVRLGDICEFGNGGAYETLIVENGDFKLISLNSIDIDGNLKNTMKRVNFYDNSLKQDDIVMVLSDVAHGDFLGLCAVIPSNDYVLNQRMGRLRKKNDCINILFLRLYINANQKYFKMQGQGSSQLNLSKKAIEDFEIPLPPLNEQAAIANVLSGLDHEIISLKNKKRQFENIKKALNHDLMSAKIRVLNK